MDLFLAGRTVLITGASQGIGAGVARTFAEEGARLRLTARSADKLHELAAELTAEFPDCDAKVFPCDLAQPRSAEALAAAVGCVDILINNAGVIPSGSLFDVDEAKWRAGWELKVFGYINLTRLYYPLMKSAGGGAIINNIGNGGEISDPRYIAGATGNASLMAFTRALGGASLADNIRIIGVNPGPVNTDRIFNMLRKRAKDVLSDEARFTDLAATYPLGRPAHVREVADLIMFLASERSAYTSGTIVTLDGGIASRRSIV